jgi:hypothetical protein
MNGTPHSDEPRQTLPSGLVFFPPGTDAGRKRRRLLFAGFFLVLTAALVWPVYPLLAGLMPPILGLPPALAWMVVVLAAAFAALLALYLTEEDDSEDAAGEA